jgi:hypothetical protein
MKLTYTSGKFTVDFTGEQQRELFEQIATFQEVFDNSTCGKCGSTNIQFVVREAKDANGDVNQYYELRCKDCGAKLAFGCHKKGGGLFPKRKDSEGEYLPTNGWVKWNKDSGKEE